MTQQINSNFDDWHTLTHLGRTCRYKASFTSLRKCAQECQHDDSPETLVCDNDLRSRPSFHRLGRCRNRRNALRAVQRLPHDRTGGANRVETNLHCVVGHKASAMDSFSYSKPKPVQETDVTWTAENLDKHPADPRGFILSRDVFSGHQERRGSLEYHRLPEAELLSYTTHTSAPSVRC